MLKQLAAFLVDDSTYLAGTDYTVYTAPTGYSTLVTKIIVQNSASVDTWVTMYHRSGTEDDNEDSVLKNYYIPVGGVVEDRVMLTMAAADYIEVNASDGDDIRFKLWGEEYYGTRWKRLGVLDIDGSTNPVDTDTLLYTVPVTTETLISTIRAVSRVSTAAVTVVLYHVPSGQSVGAIYGMEFELPGVGGSGEASMVDLTGIPATAGDKIYVRSDTANVNFVVYGEERAL
jgi:hypothetical protein